jgi:cell fate regulator YaaT (PSP1 superfamily)
MEASTEDKEIRTEDRKITTEDRENEDNQTVLTGVRFKPCGKIYVFDADGLDLKRGDKVVVESMFGLTIGTVFLERVEDHKSSKPLKKVIRKAGEEDLRAVEKNRVLETEAKSFCLERIHARGLPMKLVHTESTLDRKRIVFYFTADGRIDFRELVKDLASKFRTRIEMRQIGVRDEAKLIGGIGICGRELCCTTFLPSFAPISIRMAKEQELVLNTSKISGLCGRLMCCLNYEQRSGSDGEDKEIVSDESMEGCLCEECTEPGDGGIEGVEEAGSTSSSVEVKSVAFKERKALRERVEEKERALPSADRPPSGRESLPPSSSDNFQEKRKKLSEDKDDRRVRERKKRASRHKRHKRRKRRHRKG